jgi:hypothetical protein
VRVLVLGEAAAVLASCAAGTFLMIFFMIFLLGLLALTSVGSVGSEAG